MAKSTNQRKLIKKLIDASNMIDNNKNEPASWLIISPKYAKYFENLFIKKNRKEKLEKIEKNKNEDS